MLENDIPIFVLYNIVSYLRVKILQDFKAYSIIISLYYFLNLY